jgi:hypothetical protein
VKVLVKRLFKNWTKATDFFKAHQANDYHQTALVFSEGFVCNLLKPEYSIASKAEKERVKRIRENRAVLASVVKSVLFCGQTGIALRGHRDDGICEDDNRSQAQYQHAVSKKDVRVALSVCPQ